MSDPRGIESGSTFARSLVDAGKSEQPPADAAARVLERVAGAGRAPAAAAAAGFGWKGASTLAAVVVVAAALGAITVVRRDDAAKKASGASPVKAATVASTVNPSTPGLQPPQVGPIAGRVALSACERVDIPDREPTVCSQDGRPVMMEVVDTCASDVDLFWVDFKCRETFVARLTSGQTFDHATYDTHPWRVRDHATHRLIKEWVGPRLPDPPKDPPRPDVVIREGVSAADVPPRQCSRFGNKAPIRFSNERKTGVSIVFWVDYECHEQLYKRMEPGEIWDQSTYDTHPWRVRDENGQLLVDFIPDGVDQTVYVSLP